MIVQVIEAARSARDRQRVIEGRIAGGVAQAGDRVVLFVVLRRNGDVISPRGRECVHNPRLETVELGIWACGIIVRFQLRARGVEQPQESVVERIASRRQVDIEGQLLAGLDGDWNLRCPAAHTSCFA